MTACDYPGRWCPVCLRPLLDEWCIRCGWAATRERPTVGCPNPALWRYRSLPSARPVVEYAICLPHRERLQRAVSPSEPLSRPERREQATLWTCLYEVVGGHTSARWASNPMVTREDHIKTLAAGVLSALDDYWTPTRRREYFD